MLPGILGVDQISLEAEGVHQQRRELLFSKRLNVNAETRFAS